VAVWAFLSVCWVAFLAWMFVALRRDSRWIDEHIARGRHDIEVMRQSVRNLRAAEDAALLHAGAGPSLLAIDEAADRSDFRARPQRLVYADWLDEQNTPEAAAEASRQRRLAGDPKLTAAPRMEFR
jgi:uncharacterized protein (TIGR02996 family)